MLIDTPAHYQLKDARKLPLKKLTITFAGSCLIFFSAVSQAAAPCDSDAVPPVLTKEIALKRLLQCNLDIVDSKRYIISNQANLAIAGQMQNPNLTIGVGSISPKLGVGSGPYFDKTIDNSVRYEQLIERGNKRDLRKKSAQSQVAASSEDVLDVERQQSITLLRAMVDLAAVNARIDLLSQVVALYDEALKASTIRTEKGDLPAIDVQRQKIDANRAQIELRLAQTEARSAQIALAKLLAWETKANALEVDPAILDITALDASNFDLSSRADIKAAKLRVESAASQLDLAQALRKSDITAGVQYDHWPTSNANTNGTGDTISFTIGLPLTVNHSYEGEIARANSDYEAAKEALTHTEANAKTEWERINADVASAETNLEILQKEQLPRAEDVASTVELGYKKGALSLLELLDARRMLRQTRLDTVNARANLARAVLTRNQSISLSSVNY